VTPWRSWLYVPAHRMDRVEKAFNSIADCVVLDLEDSVPAEQKQLALENCLTILTATKEKPFIIRINANTSPWHQSEISGINSCEFFSDQFAGIRIPKSETAASIHNLGETFAGRVALHPLIESAAGTLHMQALASAHDSVASISLGEADLTADLYWSD
jgi:citrate lyase subunit beta/citryl-CoA lyase